MNIKLNGEVNMNTKLILEVNMNTEQNVGPYNLAFLAWLRRSNSRAAKDQNPSCLFQKFPVHM